MTMSGCEHSSMEVVGGLGICVDCGAVLTMTGQVTVEVPVIEDEPVVEDETEEKA